VLVVGRKTATTVQVQPGRMYCFLVQALDGSDEVYKSEPVGLRGATCRE
jgi:hypothetical protein